MNLDEIQHAVTATQQEQFADEKQMRQFLTFMMDNEEYGVDILHVQEIRGYEATTVIPNAPEYVKGVLNLRGNIVPVIDLRLRFGIAPQEYSALTVIIVIKVELKAGDKVIGLIVDAVSDVHSIPLADAKPIPAMNDHLSADLVQGLVNVGDKMVALLELTKLLELQQ